MRPSVSRAILLVAAVVLLVSVAALWLAGGAGAGTARPPAAGVAGTASPSPVAAAKPTGGPAAQTTKPTVAAQPPGQARPTATTLAKPTVAAQAPGQVQVPAQTKPSDPSDPERARIVREATWTPGQLQDHFEKHGSEGPWASESVYDASARETVATGTRFTYVDRATNVERLGFFDKGGNRFTSVTRDGRRITTHFRPDRGETYVRNLYQSTYR